MVTTKQIRQSVVIHSWSSWYWRLGLASALVISGVIIAAFEAPAQAATQEGKALASRLQVETLTKLEPLTESKMSQIKRDASETSQIYARRKNPGRNRSEVTFAPHTTLPSDYGEIHQLLAG